MVPTRELAKQVADNFESLSDNLQVMSIYGGVPYEKQERELSRGVDVVVGTPGRIKDLAEKKTLKLHELKHVVLDEVDRMLDMGFADIVEEVLKFAYDLNDESAKNPQTLLFSATTPDWVYKTAKKYMTDNYKVVDMVGRRVNRTAETVQHLAIKCNYSDRAATVGDVLQFYSGEHGRAMIFAPTKRDADELTVSSSIRQECHVLHGDIPQDKREMVLAGFREGKYKVLITTDVAARGLDIPEVDLVIQLEPPKDVDSYIHRSGRTGRAGRSGACVCFYKPRALADLRIVEQKAGIKFKRIGAPTLNDLVTAAAKDAAKSLESVDEGVLEKFKEAATGILEEKDAVDQLARALAVISGMKNVEERSLLTSAKGCRTYYFKTNMEIRGPGYVFMSLERRLGTSVREGVREMRFTTDKMGCVFDVSSNFIHYIEERWTDGKYDSLERATELPDIIEPSKESYDRGQGGRGFSRGGFGGGGMNRNRMDRRGGGGGGGFGRKNGNFRSGNGGKRPYGNGSFSNDNRNKRRRFND
ncbi:DgyrCDS9713 [Dimorphilus gyrociliatus]|uniref:RNA helicase n=1 Tax=Dimorphilus gyrociliatus TaxID=2664684 RepID=A0A7I8W0I1_9ANNE|nr:DgyrCDS9713 [Dimorphilus gyrociliatus]